MHPPPQRPCPPPALAPLLALTSAFALAACGSGGQTVSGLSLRPGVAEVFHGKRFSREGNVLGINWTEYTVLDVGRDGQRLVASIAFKSKTSGFVYHPAPVGCDFCTGTIGGVPDTIGGLVATSTDGGSSWRPQAVNWDAMGSDGYLLGIAPSGSKATVVTFTPQDALNTTYNFIGLADLDLDQGKLSAIPGLEGQRLLVIPTWFSGGKLRGMFFDRDPRGVAGGVSYLEHTIGGGIVGWQESLPSLIIQSSDLETGRWISNDGTRFFGFGSTQNVQGGYCFAVGEPLATHTTPLVCATGNHWPTMGSPVPHLVSGGPGVWFRDDTLNTIAQLPSENNVVLTALGPGSPSGELAWRSLHPRFGRLVPVLREGKPHFFDVKQDGSAEELTFPTSPCESDAACGSESRLAWAEPLGEGAYLGFWVVNVAPAPGIEQVIFAGKVTPPRAPLMTTTPANAFVAAHPEADEAGEYDQACILAAACWGVTPESCHYRFDTYPLVRSGPVGKLLAAAKAGCDAVRALWTEPGLVNQQPCASPGICVGNALVTKCSGTVQQAVDCGLLDETCQKVSGYTGCFKGPTSKPVCNQCSADGTAMYCPPATFSTVVEEDCATYGMSCDAQGRCSDPCVGQTSHCEGQVAMCSGGVGNRADCTLVGGTCQLATNGSGFYGCTPPHPPTQPGCTLPAQCVGDILGFCSPNQGIKWVDCKKLGLRCDGGRCVQ